MFTGCVNDKYSRHNLCDVLSSCYSATAEYTLESEGKDISGSFEILRSDNTVLNFISPEELTSVSISSEKGENEIFTFELHGISASVPKSIATDLSLIFSLFSDEIPAKILSLDDENFTINEENRCSVSFTENEITYSILYDAASGIPKTVTATGDKSSVSVNIENLEISEK